MADMALQAAVSGSKVAQARIDNISNNIANISIAIINPAPPRTKGINSKLINNSSFIKFLIILVNYA